MSFTFKLWKMSLKSVIAWPADLHIFSFDDLYLLPSINHFVLIGPRSEPVHFDIEIDHQNSFPLKQELMIRFLFFDGSPVTPKCLKNQQHEWRIFYFDHKIKAKENIC